MPISDDQLRALETQIAPAAVSAARLTGVPAELLCAQAILESGWLEHAPGNNCFGIKSYQGQYGRQLLRTREWLTPQELARFIALGDARTAQAVLPERKDELGRTLYDVRDWFATFATLGDCFLRRALLFTEGRYVESWKRYLENRDLEAFVRAMAPIYATDSHYADAVLAIARMPEVTSIVEQLHQK